jgi:hypothetical protein
MEEIWSPWVLIFGPFKGKSADNSAHVSTNWIVGQSQQLSFAFTPSPRTLFSYQTLTLISQNLTSVVGTALLNSGTGFIIFDRWPFHLFS